MTDPTFTPEADRELLVVYPTHQAADGARTALQRAGVPADEIHVGREPDVVAALRAEMHEELTQAWVVPNAGVAYPKEGAEGVVLFSIVGVVLGVLVAFPLALIDVGSSYPVRLLVFAIVGATFGLTVALVAGAGIASRRPGEPNAATRGTVLRVDRDSPALRQLLADLHPIRLDEIAHDGMPIATITTEGPDTPAEGAAQTVRDAATNVTGDDYHPQR